MISIVELRRYAERGQNWRTYKRVCRSGEVRAGSVLWEAKIIEGERVGGEVGGKAASVTTNHLIDTD